MGFGFIHIKGWKSFPIKTEKSEFIRKYIYFLEQELKSSAIHNVVVKDREVKFRAPIFRFVWNGWNRFNPVSRGEFHFRSIANFGIVEYRIWFLEFFVLALIFSIIPFFGIFPSLFWRIIALLTIWIIYLINILIATHRIENYLGKLAHKLNKELQKPINRDIQFQKYNS